MRSMKRSSQPSIGSTTFTGCTSGLIVVDDSLFRAALQFPARMREGIAIRLRPGDQERLQAVVADRKTPQHHAWRARIVLMTADGV